MDILADSIISNIAHVIQLAVAPVFLLAGIGSLLNVLAHRLARIIDRARIRESALTTTNADDFPALKEELNTLSRRMRFTNWAITLCTCGALLVCLVVALLFVSALLKIEFAKAIAALFILAMGSVIIGLLSFLAEIYIATGSIRIGDSLRNR